MGQIVKRKKKGRPPKVDPAGRSRNHPESDLRRSLRRRNVKYVFDLDDYFDEDEFYADEEERRRREKKLKHLLSAGGTESTGRVDHAPAASESSSDGGEKPCKKRKIDEYVNEGENDDNNGGGDNNYIEEDDEEVRERKLEHRTEDSSLPGTPAEAPAGLPLPDKKALELILDKLQKKDIYGVYAEPVDPEELPDYHDVIEHPMDFATVRNKLRNGSYGTFEQFESDVFLICSNAMQYNSADTIYYKQARAIQELAKKKFQKIRLNVESIEREVRPEPRMRSSSNLKKQIKRSISRTLQKPIGSDFSSGATLATTDFQNATNAIGTVGSEKRSFIDGLIDGNSFLIDNNTTDKVEEPGPGKGLPSRLSRRTYVPDENRRATYSISLSQPVASRESTFSTFDGEAKQLVPVGVYSDNSYAQSLARFSAALGSFPWKVSSKRIEQALPQGYKFGQGWIGEYEPLPTALVVLGNCTVKEPPFLAKVQPARDPGKFSSTVSDSSKEFAGCVPFLEQQLPFLGPAGIRPPSVSFIPTQPIRENGLEMKPSFFLSSGIKPGSSPNHGYHHQNLRPRDFVESDRKASKQVELNGLPSLNLNAAKCAGNKQISKNKEIVSESSSKNTNCLPLGSCKQPDSSSIALKPTSYYPQEQGQGHSVPVQLMRMPAEDARIEENPSNTSLANTSHVLPPVPSSTSHNATNASVAAARAWMSVGAGAVRPGAESANMNENQLCGNSLHKAAHDMPSQALQFRGEFPPAMTAQIDKNNSQVIKLVPQGAIPMMVSNQMPFQNQRMVFPQLATTDLSRFQLHPSWRNLSPQMQSLPPDLNMGFQSSGSPGGPSSGVLVDSQQPDLALQL